MALLALLAGMPITLFWLSVALKDRDPPSRHGLFAIRLLQAFCQQGLVVKHLAGLPTDEARVDGVTRDQADTLLIGRVLLADLCFVAHVGFGGCAADQCQADGQRKK